MYLLCFEISSRFEKVITSVILTGLPGARVNREARDAGLPDVFQKACVHFNTLQRPFCGTLHPLSLQKKGIVRGWKSFRQYQ